MNGMRPRVYRVYRVRAPWPEGYRYDILQIIRTTIGTIAAVVAIAFVAVVYFTVSGDVTLNSVAITLIGAMAFVLAALVCLTVFAHKKLHAWVLRHRIRTASTRFRRLGVVTANESLYQRFPHRVIELAYRHGMLGSRRHERFMLSNLRPGSIVIIDDKSMLMEGWEFYVHIDPAAPCTVFFEPLSLINELHELYALLYGSADASRTQASGAPSNQTETPIAWPRRVKRWLAATDSRINEATYPYIRLMSALVYLSLIARNLRNPLNLFLLIFLFIVMAMSLVYREKWWIVPGGLVLREDRLWRRDARVTLFPIEGMALCLNSRAGTGAMLWEGRLRRFAIPKWAGPLIARGLHATCHRPDLAAVRSYLCSDAETSECTEREPGRSDPAAKPGTACPPAASEDESALLEKDDRGDAA